MDITFLIGNGFDLRLGLKSSYIDVYKKYVKTESPNENIYNFKKHLKSHEQENYKTWSDFEISMGEHSINFEKEKDFVDCVRDFKRYIGAYLSLENRHFLQILGNSIDTLNEFYNFVTTFHVRQNNNVKNDISHRINKSAAFQGVVEYNFISFNYTKLLDGLVNSSNKKGGYNSFNEVIHVNGSLSDSIALGVNNIEQIKNESFRSSSVKNAFVKPHFNTKFDKKRISDAKEIIDKSEVICIYGLELGDSDKMWRDYICEWLIKDFSHELFIFRYPVKKFGLYAEDEKMDEEEIAKKEFFNKSGFGDAEIDRVNERVHFTIGYDMFDFTSKLTDEQIIEKGKKAVNKILNEKGNEVLV